MDIGVALKKLPGCSLDFMSELQSNGTYGSLKGKLHDTAFVLSYNHPEFVMLTATQDLAGKWRHDTNILANGSPSSRNRASCA